MITYPIDPEYCLILKSLRETKSLREAAQLLRMDPAHLSRKIQKISEEHDLIQKISNRWVLTEKGNRLAQWVDEGIIRQKVLLEEKPILKMACFTWLAEQMLIPGFQRLNEETQHKLTWRFSIVASDLESELISGRADYVITCHAPNDPLIAHKVFHPDPWIIIAPVAWKKEIQRLRPADLIDYLQTKPFLRLSSLNPEQMLGFAPLRLSEFMVDGVIGVRAGVINGLGWSCLPSFALRAALKNEDVFKLDLESATKGQLSVWWLRSRKDSLSHIKPISKWLKNEVSFS